MSKFEVTLHGGSAEVDIPVFEAQFLLGLRGISNDKRRDFGWT
jgi:hypothetical protein